MKYALAKFSKRDIPKLKKKLKQLVNAKIRSRKICVAKGVDGRTCWGYIQASHIFPEGVYQNLRFDESNILPMCTWHHLYWWHKNPIEAGEWVKKFLGEKKYEALKKKSKEYKEWSVATLTEEIKKYG